MRVLSSFPWHYWIFAGGLATVVAIFSAMHQQDPKDNFRDRPVVIALGGLSAIAALICGGVGVVKFVLWWRG